MTSTPEQQARREIDRLLVECGWVVQDRASADLRAGHGVAIREFPLQGGEEADYLLYADGKAIGVVEAKPVGHTLTGVELQSRKYTEGLPADLPAHRRPLPFAYETTGDETRFTNGLDPHARSREVFAFHRPETLIEWVGQSAQLRARLQQMPPLLDGALWPIQATAIRNLETSLAANRPRALIQMATGSGKTFTAVNQVYRLIRHADARRILFLVDRGNLGRQANKEFQQFITPDDGRKFTELYNVQHLQGNRLDDVARVCITTIQRLYSMLKGEEEYDTANEEGSMFNSGAPLAKEPVPVAYNPRISIEAFDIVIIDECHRSIYNLWRQVLDYFDAFLIGLTATPSKETLGFFNQNLVAEYGHEQAVADRINVNFDVFRIRTRITESGSKIDASTWVDKRDRLTRRKRWEMLDEDVTYDAKKLDRDVVAVDQIRTVIRCFRDSLPTIFPGRTHVPKTLIYAKDDSHADDIVQIIREEFARGNDFCQKITYKTTGVKTDDLIAEFRNSYNPRIVVTVDMIATGTDIKPLEIVMFMRSVKSRIYFEQMKGRGVRVIGVDDFKAVTPDGDGKTHFVIVDAVGVCEACKTDSKPLDRKPAVSFEKLLESVAFGRADEEVVSAIASRLDRLDRRMSKEQQDEVAESTGGTKLRDLVHSLVKAVDPDEHLERAKQETGAPDPTHDQIKSAAQSLASDALRPLMNPAIRNKLIDIKKSFEQVIDTVSQDQVVGAEYDAKAQERARDTVTSFEKFIAEHKDEIDAMQVMYSQPYRRRLTFEDIKKLSNAIGKPPLSLTTERLWQAYQALDRSKVHGGGGKQLADIVSVVRFAIHQDENLIPFAEAVNQRFEAWLESQEAQGKSFTAEQRRWLELMKDHIATSMSISPDDFDFTPFNEEGGIGKVYQLFGDEFNRVLDELNEVLLA